MVGIFLTRPIFRFIHYARLREMYTALALLIVVGIALLMKMIGLSPALGTFLAGVVLANSEFRHELHSDIEPFKGLLLGLFLSPLVPELTFLCFWKSVSHHRANHWLNPRESRSAFCFVIGVSH